EVVADNTHADGAARLEVRISDGHPIGFGKGPRNDLGDRRCGAVDHRLLRQRPVHGGEGLSAEGAGQGAGLVLDPGRDRSGGRGSDDGLLLTRVPPTDFDRANLLRRCHARTEFDQVVAEDKLKGIGMALVVALRRSAGGLYWLAEIELAIFHAHLVADLARARLEEVPVG